jgi:hypothetical protein
MDFWTFIKNYQSGIGSLIGFTGVVVTLFVNAMLARRQSARNARMARDQADYAAQLSREQADRQLAHDRRAVRQAFVADLSRITDYLKMQISGLETKAPMIPISNQPISGIFDHFAGKLSLLTQSEIYNIILSYRRLQETRQGIIYAINAIPELKAQSVGDFFIPAVAHYPNMINVYRAVVVGLDETISVINDAMNAEVGVASSPSARQVP